MSLGHLTRAWKALFIGPIFIFLISDIATADDVASIFEKDPNAALMLSKKEKPKKSPWILLKAEWNAKEELLQRKIGHAGFGIFKYYSLKDLRRRIPKCPKGPFDCIGDGTPVLVRGHDEYVKIFGDQKQDWPYIAVIRGTQEIMAVVPASQPTRAIDLRDFEVERESYYAAGGNCKTKQSPEEPPIPKTMAEVDRVRADALAGNSDSQWVMGILHEEGLHLQKNIEKALAWFRKSAKQCNKYAQNSLGRLHYLGLGVERDVYKAQFYFLKSAARKNWLAALNQGVMLMRPHHELSGNSFYGQSWVATAYANGNPYVKGKARTIINALAREDAKRALSQMKRNKRSAGAANCNPTFGFSCNTGIDMWMFGKATGQW